MCVFLILWIASVFHVHIFDFAFVSSPFTHVSGIYIDFVFEFIFSSIWLWLECDDVGVPCVKPNMFENMEVYLLPNYVV